MTTTIIGININASEYNADNSVVQPIWSNVDRAENHAWVVPNKYLPRFIKAIHAGKMFGPATIKIDVNGKTYAEASIQVYMRTLNRDLTRLGF